MAKNILLIIVFCVIVYFSKVLFSMQFTLGENYYLASVSNNFSKKIILPQRGEIFDVDGKLLAENLIEYEILLGGSLLSEDDFRNFISKIKQEEKFLDNLQNTNELALKDQKIVERGMHAGFVVLENLTQEEYDDFFKKFGEVKGLIGIETPLRVYKYPYEFAHVVGYLGSSGLTGLELAGKSGVEQFYDDIMRGKAGERYVYKSNDGAYAENLSRRSSKGDSLYLTIDSDWQLLLYNLMNKEMDRSGAYGGAAVIVESGTGEVQAMVSLPSFDNNNFNKGVSIKDFERLSKDIRKPMLNKALSVNISPGSTIKPFVALFALKDKVIDPTYEYESKGCEDLGTDITFCEADSKVLGNVGLSASIFKSSNLYYCSIARRYEEVFEGQGIQYLLDDFDSIGFLEKSGIDLSGEVAGTLPSPERIQRSQGRNWSNGDSCNMVIGQGDLTISPIKLSMLASFIDNSGVIYQPYIVKKAVDEKGDITIENFPVEKLQIEMEGVEYFDLLKRAMRKTVDEVNGSAHSLRDIDMDLRIKTGSADAKEILTDGRVIDGAHSWVMGSFQYENKNYSFAMVQLYGGRGYQTLPVVGNFLNCISSDTEYPNCIKY
jgi:penicillin-binding protein 2